ncbi:MAG: Ig-like domain-containing protein, partial [Oscillospiraceae bacterium]|nr:Ig-like domain-containing protein [Oscillospiraceae bacterium]
LELYPTFMELPAETSIYLDYNVKDNEKVIWESSNPGVAAVDAEGLITALSEGLTYISASLADKPGVTAECGIYVVPADEDDDVWDCILIWEDFPPPDEYASERYGLTVKGGSDTNADKAGNIPIDITPSINKAAGKKQPVRKHRISRKEIKRKKKDKLYWTISVKSTSTIFQDYLERNQTEELTVQITKAGGDSLEGDYYGVIYNIRTDDYTPHFSKWPDHSYCSDGCNQLWDEYYNQRWNKYLYMNGLGRDYESPVAVILEWELSRTIRYENYYANPKTKSFEAKDPILTIGKGSADASSVDDFLKFERDHRDDYLKPSLSAEMAKFTAEFVPLEKVVSTRPTNLGNWNSKSIEFMDNSPRYLDFTITKSGFVIVTSSNHRWTGFLTTSIYEKNVPTADRATLVQNETSESWYDLQVTGADEPPVTGLPYLDSDGWPAEYIPASIPRYPDGRIHAVGDARQMRISIAETSKETMLGFIDMLKDADWTIEDIEDPERMDFRTYGRKGYWLIEIGVYNANASIDLTYQHS